MSQGFEQTVRELLIKEFRVDEAVISPEATFKQMGLDSLDVVSFVMALEDRLGLEIPEGELNGVETFGDASALIERKQAARA